MPSPCASRPRSSSSVGGAVRESVIAAGYAGLGGMASESIIELDDACDHVVQLVYGWFSGMRGGNSNSPAPRPGDGRSAGTAPPVAGRSAGGGAGLGRGRGRGDQIGLGRPGDQAGCQDGDQDEEQMTSRSSADHWSVISAWKRGNTKNETGDGAWDLSLKQVGQIGGANRIRAEN